MNRTRRTAVLSLAAIVTAATMIPLISRGADVPATVPASTQAATQARGSQEIIMDLRATSAQLQQVMPSTAFLDETARKASAEKAVPLLRKMSSLLGELANSQTEPEAKAEIAGQQHEFYAFLVAFGDKDTIAILEKEGAGKDANAVQAKSALALGQWWENTKNPAAQLKVLNDYAAVAKANPADPGVVQTLGTMWQLGSANQDVSKKVIEVVKTNMSATVAKGLITEAEGGTVQLDMVGKPFTVAGRTTTGTTFTSNDLKGKVVLIDFWATWCGPCNAELPRTKKLYDDYHAKGLEIVGVDCDTGDDIVNTFTKDKQMPWTQLRETTQTDQDNWHPLAKQWHVDGIPAMFLIDKNGVLRYVDAREGTEDKVKSLLAEATTQPAK